VKTQIRAASPDDIALVLDATRRSLHDRYPWIYCPDRVWNVEAHKRLAALLSRASVVVACDPEFPDVVWGFALVEPAERRLHYVYVKFSFRGFGIARALIESVWPDVGGVPIAVTTLPDKGRVELLRKHQMSFNPFEGLFSNKENPCEE
jgi:GNAT superfamily N-acetyltransferase